MTDKVEPALTPEEWKALETPVAGEPFMLWIESMVGSPGWYGRKHAIAAMALSGQPFGFTREDVDVLRSMLIPHPVGVYDQHLARLKARIEALLPPEGT